MLVISGSNGCTLSFVITRKYMSLSFCTYKDKYLGNFLTDLQFALLLQIIIAVLKFC